MVKRAARHWWGASVVFWSVIFLISALGGWFGRHTITSAPIPYTFEVNEAETGWREDGYHLVGTVHKRECDRDPVPQGYWVSADTPSGTVNVTWQSLLHPDPNHRRPAGSSDPFHHVFQLPDAFIRATVYTLHTCPSEGAEDARKVLTIMHVIEGNVIEQRVLSPEEIAK